MKGRLLFGLILLSGVFVIYGLTWVLSHQGVVRFSHDEPHLNGYSTVVAEVFEGLRYKELRLSVSTTTTSLSIFNPSNSETNMSYQYVDLDRDNTDELLIHMSDTSDLYEYESAVVFHQYGKEWKNIPINYDSRSEPKLWFHSKIVDVENRGNPGKYYVVERHPVFYTEPPNVVFEEHYQLDRDTLMFNLVLENSYPF